MPHALIIDDNLLVSNVLKERLAPLGFDSFESSWTEDEAVTAAERRIPDLVVVGDAVEAGCPVNAARRISERHDVPVLMVTANAASLRNLSLGDVKMQGPFQLNNLPIAILAAGQIPPQEAAADIFY